MTPEFIKPLTRARDHKSSDNNDFFGILDLLDWNRIPFRNQYILWLSLIRGFRSYRNTKWILSVAYQQTLFAAQTSQIREKQEI